MEAAELVGYVANGVVFGSILALGAVGLSLVYGILKLSNFAHGDFVTLGAFASFLFAVEQAGNASTLAIVGGLLLGAWLVADLSWLRRLGPLERRTLGAFAALLVVAGGWLATGYSPSLGTTNGVLLVATLLAVLVTVGFVIGLEFALWRPLRRKRATVLSFIIVSIGVALVLRNALQLRFGPHNRSYLRPVAQSDLLLGARISDAQQFALVAALVLILGVHVVLRYTRIGKALRALSDNPELARASGVDVDRMILYVWTLAGALTAVAGVLLTLVLNNNMHVNMGFSLLLPLFAAVLLGGIGSPYGAIAGGFIVGIAMKTSVLWLGNEYELATAFLLLIGVMLVRPQGLFGSRA